MAVSLVQLTHDLQRFLVYIDLVYTELRDRGHLCYKSIINYDLDITKILVVSPQIRYIEVCDITNPRFNELSRSPATSLNRGSTVLYWPAQVVPVKPAGHWHLNAWIPMSMHTPLFKQGLLHVHSVPKWYIFIEVVIFETTTLFT